MWFFTAAYEIVEKYDRARDHDGPRHWETGIALMVGKLLQITMRTRGVKSAEQMADKIEGQCAAWKLRKIDDVKAAQ